MLFQLFWTSPTLLSFEDPYFLHCKTAWTFVLYSVSPCYSWFYRSLSYPASHLFLRWRVLLCFALPDQKPFLVLQDTAAFSQTACSLLAWHGFGCDQATPAPLCLTQFSLHKCNFDWLLKNTAKILARQWYQNNPSNNLKHKWHCILPDHWKSNTQTTQEQASSLKWSTRSFPDLAGCYKTIICYYFIKHKII